MDRSDWTKRFNPKISTRRIWGQIWYSLFLLAILIGVIGLTILIIRILFQGIPWLSITFLTEFPSRFPERAGMKSAIFGSIWVIGLTAAFTVPVGVGAAIYLEEYARKNWIYRIVEINVANLAGVPSIVYGLLGLAVFVQLLSLGRSVVAGALTMSLLVLPIVIITSREAIRSVPSTYREAAYGLGATQFQVVKSIVVPQALPGLSLIHI